MFTDILRTLRVKKGDTQDSIAEKLNVPKRTYASWERGERAIPHDMLISIANMYGVTIDYLMGRDEPVVSTQPNAPDSRTARRAEAYEILQQLSDENYQAMLTLLRSMTEKKG